MNRKFISYNGRIVGDSGLTSANMVEANRTTDVPQ